jgi:hypothetical protein
MKISQIILIATVAILTGCSTNYFDYSGSKPIIGRGGASTTLNGVDLWIEGTPPRKFQIIGVITDNRPGGPIPMAARNGQIAALVKKKGGDAALMSFDEREFAGTCTSGDSYTSAQATAYGSPGFAQAYGSSTTVGSEMTHAIYRRSSKFYVIRYL